MCSVGPIRLLHRELLECIQINSAQRTLLGSTQLHLWNCVLRNSAIFVRPESLQPATRAQAPFTPLTQTCDTKIVALGGGEVKELFGDNARYSVVAEISSSGAAVAVSMEAGKGRFREEGKGLFED